MESVTVWAKPRPVKTSQESASCLRTSDSGDGSGARDAGAGGDKASHHVITFEGREGKSKKTNAQAHNFSADFAFDRVLGADVSQSDVFASGIPDLIDKAFQGTNVAVITYGQTSSGKTYTLIGDSGGNGGGDGILPRTLRYCLDHHRQAGNSNIRIAVQVMELYNEQIRDLLVAPSASPSTSPLLQIRQDEKCGGAYVSGLREVPVHCATEVDAVLKRGLGNRSVAETKMNEASSRSHCIVFISIYKCRGDSTEDGVSVHAKNQNRNRTKNQSENENRRLISRISLADLAGSERHAKTLTKGKQLTEGGAINRSLSALEKVVNDLHHHYKKNSRRPQNKSASSDSKTDGVSNCDKGSRDSQTTSTKGGHVNFRDSKLTRILQPFLTGGGCSLFILCLSPAITNAQETWNTMKFGRRLQGISQPVTLIPAPSHEDDAESIHEIEENDMLNESDASEGADALEQLRAISAPSKLAHPAGAPRCESPMMNQRRRHKFITSFARDFIWTLANILLYAFIVQGGAAAISGTQY